MRAVAFLSAGIMLTRLAPAPSGDIPAHPRLLSFEERTFRVPEANERRVELADGIVAFLERDSFLPLIEITLAFGVGSQDDPPGRTGLAFLTGAMLSRGGSAALSPAELDATFEGMGVDLASFVRARTAIVRLSTPSWAADEAIDQLFDLLAAPRFDSDILENSRRSVLEGLGRRNENALDVLEREWTWLMLGPSHAGARAPTPTTIESITRLELVSFYECFWRPSNLIAALSGDVSDEVLRLIDRRGSEWHQGSGDARACDSSSTAHPTGSLSPRPAPGPGTRVAFHPAPQAKIRIGHRIAKPPAATERERFALRVAGEILGGGGAISRLNGRLRTSEGLVYRANAEIELDRAGEEEFRIFLETRTDRAWRAVDLALEEVERLRNELVHPRELDVVRETLIGNLRSEFDTAEEIVGYLAENVVLDRPDDYWNRYLEAVRTVTREEVRAAARKFIRPEDFSVLVVGPKGRILEGAERGLMILPERDPRTLEPLAATDRPL